MAGEVKTLATQTEQATDKILEEINGMQDVSKETLIAYEVNDAIGNVPEYIISVADAIEEQSATISQISDNMQVAFEGVSQITGSINKMVRDD